MKSQFFKDMQGLGTAPNLAGRISVCLLLNRDAYLQAVQEAARLGITSGEYIDRLMMKNTRPLPLPLSAGRLSRRPSDSP